MHHLVKFCANRSNCCGDMAVFQFFQHGGVRYLVLVKVENFNWWTCSEGQYASTCQISCQSLEPLRRYGHFSISQNGGRPPSWIFEVRNFTYRSGAGRPICVSMPNFVSIDLTFVDIWPTFDLSRWRPSVILDLFYVYLDHPRRVFVGLCHFAKFLVGIDAVVSIICQF